MLRVKGLIVSFVGLVVVGSCVVGAPMASAHPSADSNVLWQMLCGVDHFGADDPIVYPNQPGKSHMHSFYGNSTTNATSTPASLLAGSASCGRNMQASDRSAYWIPSLYRNSNGTATLLNSDSQLMFIYYRRPGGSSGPKIQPFPAGLRMIAGDSHATQSTPQSLYVTDWDCGGGGPEYAHIPQCGTDNSNSLHASIEFPNCWDGHNLDSADHKSHMAYANLDSGACPASHPVSLPQITYEIDYPGIAGGPAYQLSSGGQYSMHGDFFAAWDSRVQNALVTACLNAARDCIDVNRDGNTLTAGDDHPVPPINLADFQASPQVLGDKIAPPVNVSPAVAAIGAAPAPSTPLPDTGATTVAGSILGAGLIAYFAYQIRFRRRSLRQLLTRSGRPH